MLRLAETGRKPGCGLATLFSFQRIRDVLKHVNSNIVKAYFFYGSLRKKMVLTAVLLVVHAQTLCGFQLVVGR